MNFFKINFRCIFFKIQRKVTEQTAAEAAVEVVLQHMMQHVKNIFRRRQHRIGLTVKRKGRCFQMIRRENLVHQLIRTGKLIDADDAVVQLKREGTVRVRERIAVGNVVVRFSKYGRRNGSEQCFSARRYKAEASTPVSVTGSDESVHKFFKNL